MTTVNGDPELENAYNTWKENIMRVTQAHPSDESILVGNAYLSNTTIFRHLKEAGYSKERLEDMIPTEGSIMLGIELYRKEIFIDHTGQLEFIDPKLLIQPPVAVDDEGCEHGFVIYDEDEFLCKECDERFPRHPDLMAKEVRAIQLSEVELLRWLGEFRGGHIT